MLKKLIYALIILVLAPCFTRGQVISDSVSRQTDDKRIEADTTVQKQLHSPHKASLYSAILPGLGQAYNHKYWKIPILYAGLGTMYYFISSNNKEYQMFKDAYGHKLIYGDTAQAVNEYEAKYSLDGLKAGKNYFRRNRDLSIILTSVIYLLNIVDAAVDAHLYYWEVSDNLSLELQPGLMNLPLNRYTPVMGITLKF